MPVLAALATVPGREAALTACLTSLRPQVDRLHVWCQGHTHAPDAVKALADTYVLSPENTGAEAKLSWARAWRGLYLSCDDDFAYPPDYTAVMWRWVKRWKGRAVVSLHGRWFTGQASWPNWQGYIKWNSPLKKGVWVNHVGTGVMAFDARLQVPNVWPKRNCLDGQFAVWAQEQQVPLFVAPHTRDWLTYLLTPEQEKGSIWVSERKTGFQDRNAVMTGHQEWRVSRCRG